MLQVVNDDNDLLNFLKNIFYKLIKSINFRYEKHVQEGALIDTDDIII